MMLQFEKRPQYQEGAKGFLNSCFSEPENWERKFHIPLIFPTNFNDVITCLSLE